MTRAAWAGGSTNFSHDVVSRPTEQARENTYGTGWGWQADDDLGGITHHGLGALTYGYNAAGQVTSRSTIPSFDWTPPPGYGRVYGQVNPQNQVSSEAQAPIIFDQSGAMTNDGATAYTYDLADRLITATGPLGTGAYAYDAQGRRDRRTANGTTLYTQWSGEEEVAEYDASLAIRYRFIPGPGVDRKIAVVGVSGAVNTAQPTRYLHTDVQGSVMAATTESGLIPRLTAYSPWGEVSGTGLDASSGMAWGYAGRPHDSETGLVYVRARYYLPRLGQWLTTDPIGTEDDPNLYIYVGLDPLNFEDPSGQNRIVRRVGTAIVGRAIISNARRAAVGQAWSMERRLVRETGQGTRAWTNSQRRELLAEGRVSGFRGHHINDVQHHPDLAGNPANVAFVSTGEHASIHAATGGTRGTTTGELIDRTLGGALPIPAPAASQRAVSQILGSVFVGVQVVASLDPVSALLDPDYGNMQSVEESIVDSDAVCHPSERIC